MRCWIALCTVLLPASGMALSQTTDGGFYHPVDPVATVEVGTVKVKVGQSGEMEIAAGEEAYSVESCFSYPGAVIRPPDGSEGWKTIRAGWNGLPRSFNNHDNYPDVSRQRGNEGSWAPAVTKVSGDTITVEAEGECYHLVRTVRVSVGRIDVDDRFANKRRHPTAVVPRHRVTAREDFVERLIAGVKAGETPYTFELPANPTLLVTGARNGLGLVMQDNVSRRRYRFQVPQKGNRVGFQVNRVVLDRGATFTFSWSLYMMDEGQDYFDFVNRVRRDWGANVTMEGPGGFACLYPKDDDVFFYLIGSGKSFSAKSTLADPTGLRRYLAWRPERIIMATPWLDYDPMAVDHFVDRAEYRKLFSLFLPAIRKAAPEMKVVGCVETPYVTIEDREHRLPRATVGESTHSLQDELTAEQMAIIDEELGDGMAECLIRNANGKPVVELAVRAGKPIYPAVRVFPEVGNARHALLMDQARFLVEDVGLDGIYFDMFALGQWGSYRAYGTAWDGMSADIDFTTGEWHTPYKACAIAAIEAKLDVVQYVLRRGKVVLANRQSTSRDEQALPAFRFTETGSGVGACATTWQPGTRPPALPYCFITQLSTPIGLGVGEGSKANDDPARWLMKVAIIYLRHGMVFYPYHLPEPPMTEEYADAFGVLKHMFPLTPIELGEGFIVGRERLLSAVSITRTWGADGPDEPTVLIFDINGRRVDPRGRFAVTSENGRRRVSLKLTDWAEVAVIE